MNWFYIRTLFSIALLGLCLIALKLPHIYNNYIFPLGRLHRSISYGDNYAEVNEKFIKYVTEQRGRAENPDIQLLFGTRQEDFNDRPIEESQYMYLFDVSYFDEIHLGVIFNQQQQVNDIYFRTY
jgi:hypothetical protein